MNLVELSEYYLWRSFSASQYPWQRQYTNTDFLKYERKRIKEVYLWYEGFRRASEGSQIDEVSLYVVPLELSSLWKAAIASYGNYNFFGLSALNNTPTLCLIGLIDRNLKQPDDYRLIRILKSKKVHLYNTKSSFAQPALVVEEWEYLNSDYIYVDVPFEKRIIEKIISENLTSEEHIPVSFQSPIISAPYVVGGIGGVSLSSMAAKSRFAEELIKTIQLMVPPEYRATRPPKSVYRGHKFLYESGIKFHLAERPYYDRNLLRGLYARNFNPVLKEVNRRFGFKGEYSIFSTLVPEKVNISQFFTELFNNFTKTEITLPYDLDELPLMDIELTKLRKVIDEDVWLQVVYSRQIHPRLTDNVDKETIKITIQLKAVSYTHLTLPTKA